MFSFGLFTSYLPYLLLGIFYLFGLTSFSIKYYQNIQPEQDHSEHNSEISFSNIEEENDAICNFHELLDEDIDFQLSFDHSNMRFLLLTQQYCSTLRPSLPYDRLFPEELNSRPPPYCA